MASLFISGKVQEVDAAGNPLNGGKLHTYAAGTLTRIDTYTTQAGNVSNTNPVILGSDGRANVWLGSAAYRMILTDATGATTFYDTDNMVGSVASVDLSASTGSSLVGHIASGAGAVATTVQKKLRGSLDAIADFAVPNNGITSASAAIKAMFDNAALNGVGSIYFPPGTYLLTNSNTDADYNCAVVISGLRNCTVFGAKGTKFVVNTSGTGAAQFGMFRLEQCEGVEFHHFEMDGSGIVITGTGADRSRGFVLVNYNVNSKAVDLAVTNKLIEFHHIYVHDIGGFVGVPPRTLSMAAALDTDGLSVHDNRGAGLIGQDHFVGVTYTRNLHVYNNIAINTLPATAQVGNLFCDASAGTVDALIENNYAVGFTGGGKAETHIGAGPSGLEDRPCKNVRFVNNHFLELGDPITMIFPGAGGGGFYGIKLNGIDCSARDNTITARTTNRTTGGLYQGFQIVSTVGTRVNTRLHVENNSVTGTVLGINHDAPAADAGRKFTTVLRDNRLYDMVVTPGTPTASNDGTGILMSKNCLAEGNKIYRAPYAAIIAVTPDDTIARTNEAIDCCTLNEISIAARTVFQQVGTGTQGFWAFEGNRIRDSRGASSAQVGYYFAAGTTYTNTYSFTPGSSQGLLTTIAYDTYFNALGRTVQRGSTLVPAPREFLTTNTPTAIAPWNAMAWNVGDRGIFTPPTVGIAKAYVCTVAGTPGTWVSEGIL